VGLLRYVSSYSLLFPFCREVAPSATEDLEERCKDLQRLLGREFQPTTHCGCIWSHSQSTSGSGDSQLQTIIVHFIRNLMQFYVYLVYFGSWLSMMSTPKI